MNKKIIASLMLALSLSILGATGINTLIVDEGGFATNLITPYNEHPAQWAD